MKKLLIMIFAFVLVFGAMSGLAAEQWTHQHFAVWLVKAVNAENLLSPTATTQDYFTLLRRLGIEPRGGWIEDKIITIATLEEMLGLAEGSGLTFEELLKKLEALIQEILTANPALNPSVSSVLP